jgi:multisubunit Na+/H+ antiporter MnhE subunit
VEALHPTPFSGPHFLLITLTVVWVILTIGVSIGGVFVFRYEMERLFRERDNPGMRLSLWMTLFFNILYFQYYFHDIAKAQEQGSLAPTAE